MPPPVSAATASGLDHRMTAEAARIVVGEHAPVVEDDHDVVVRPGRAGRTASVSCPTCRGARASTRPSSSVGEQILAVAAESRRCAGRRDARRSPPRRGRAGGVRARATAAIRRPATAGARPRTMVSISGSSGIAHRRAPREPGEVVERRGSRRAPCASRPGARAARRRAPAASSPAIVPRGRASALRSILRRWPKAARTTARCSAASATSTRGAPASSGCRRRPTRPSAAAGSSGARRRTRSAPRRRSAPGRTARRASSAPGRATKRSRDLALQHQHGAREAGARARAAGRRSRRRDVVRQVRDDRRPAGSGDQRGERPLEDVADDDLDARVVRVALRRAAPRGRGRSRPAYEPPGARRQLVGERAQPGADLEHARGRADRGGVDDPVRDGGVAEEVLAAALLRAEPGGGERLARVPARAHHAGPGHDRRAAPRRPRA